MFFVIKDNIIDNMIELNGMSVEDFERLEEVKLMPVESLPGARLGDAYDPATGRCLREGQDLTALINRTMRDQILSRCDYTMVADYPCSEAEKQAWREYRQALRDVPQQTGFPDNIVWPQAPEIQKSRSSSLK